MTAASPPYAFLSYSRKDQAFAAHLARDLRAHGIHLWFDQLDIAPGDDWDEAISRALHGAGAILFVVSPASVVSDNVLNELTVAVDAGKWVIPIMIATVPVPLRIARMQRIDFTSNYPAALARLIAYMRGGSSRTVQLEAIAASPYERQQAHGSSLEPFQASAPPRSRHSWMLPAIVGGIVAVGGSVALLIVIAALLSRGEPQPGARDATPASQPRTADHAAADPSLESSQGTWLAACRPAPDGTAQQASLIITRETYTAEVSYFSNVQCERPLYKVRVLCDIVNFATIRDGLFAADYRVRSVAVVPIEAAATLNRLGAFGLHDWRDGTPSELAAPVVRAMFGAPLPPGTQTYDLIAITGTTLREGRTNGRVATTAAERPTEPDDTVVYLRQ